MESEYGQAYAELYRQHWWWRAREEFLMEMFHNLNLPPRPSVLDIGCGDGLFFKRLRTFGGTIEGLESAEELVSSEARRRYSIHIGPFDDTFSPGRVYSLVLMLDVLEHLPDPLAALRQAALLLEPAGRLVITVPAFMSLWTTHDQINHHLTRYTKASLAALVSQTPLTICRQRYFFHWLAPLKLLTRYKEKYLRTTPAPPRLPSPPVNRGLLAVSQLEQKLFAHCSLPWGSSLLMICGRQTQASQSSHDSPSRDLDS